MIIHYNEHWRIRSDPLQWIVEKRQKTGAYDPKAFCTSITHAVCWLRSRQVRDCDVECGPDALDELREFLGKTDGHIRKLCKRADRLPR